MTLSISFAGGNADRRLYAGRCRPLYVAESDQRSRLSQRHVGRAISNRFRPSEAQDSLRQPHYVYHRIFSVRLIRYVIIVLYEFRC